MKRNRITIMIMWALCLLTTLQASAQIVATGGTVTDVAISGRTYRVHSFTNVGEHTFEVIAGGGEVEYLVVAGGGGVIGGGGGGAGYNGTSSSRLGGTGGSGVVIVRYLYYPTISGTVSLSRRQR